MSTGVNSGVTDENLSLEAKRSIIGAVVSIIVDTYDIFLPAIVLPAAMSYFLPASLPAVLKVALTTLIFAVTFLGRPIGSLILGNFSDKIGRKRVAMISGVGFTTVTFLLAIMPGYAQWGVMAIGFFIFLRLVDGVFLGGGYAAPVPLALERSPERLRGLVGGLVGASGSVALVLISVVQLIVLARISRPEFAAWGWRIPFLFGVLMGIAYVWYYSRVAELDLAYLARQGGMPRQPVKELFGKANLKSFGQVVLLTTGFWFAAQMVLSFIPPLLIGYLRQSPANVTWYVLIGNIGTIAAVPLFGVLGQKIGRRAMLIWGAVGITFLTTTSYYLMIQMAKSHASSLAIGAMVLIANIFGVGPVGVIHAYLNERFQTRIRSTGYSVAFTFGMIIPGLYSFWLVWLDRLVPYEYTPLILIVLGGILTLYSALMAPETRKIKLLDKVGSSALG